MHYKVIIMEVGPDYAIVMTPEFEFMKIKKKANMTEGDKIFVVEEDIINEEEDNVIPIRPKNNLFKKLIAVAAIFFVVIASVVFKGFNNQAYAMVSMEGNSSIEMELDKNEKVVQVTSPDTALSEEILKALEGKTLSEAMEEISHIIENDDYLLVSFFVSDDNGNYEKDIKSAILNDFDDIIFIKASKNDVKNYKNTGLTLCDYKVRDVKTLSQLESYIDSEEVDYDKLGEFITTHQGLIKNAKSMLQELSTKLNGNISDTDIDDDDDDDDNNSNNSSSNNNNSNTGTVNKNTGNKNNSSNKKPITNNNTTNDDDDDDDNSSNNDDDDDDDDDETT